MVKNRRVFISFLGTSRYQPVQYKIDETEIYQSTKFVQLASFYSVREKFTAQDEVVIFTTKDAEQEHYGDEGTKSAGPGLYTEFKSLDSAATIRNVHISNGESSQEIWKIFTKIYEELRPKDEVYFDITHGFRSLPLLALPLINYAKLLKKITIGGIFYGPFVFGQNTAQLYDLTDFSKLQDWTNSANIFLQTGNATKLTQLIEGDSYQKIKEDLKTFSEFVLVNRGLDIYDGSIMVSLNQSLNSKHQSAAPEHEALKPILDKISDEFASYEAGSAINGIHAARWCIGNGLIQQAATLLQEFVTSLVIEDIDETARLDDRKFRSFVTPAITKHDTKEFQYSGHAKKMDCSEDTLRELHQNILRLPDIKALKEVANKLENSIRNDINHAGFRKGARDFDGFNRSIRKRYVQLAGLLSERGIEVQSL